MSKFGVSQSVRRTEDARFITGQGRYTDDLNLAGQVFGVVVRSPVAHARIASIDVSEARAAPGVLAVYTGADLEAHTSNSVPCAIPLKNKDGSNRADPRRPVLCAERVRYVGDNVAFVVAETLEQAKDAAELVEVDYEDLPAVAETGKAMSGATIYDDIPGNVCFDWEYGDTQQVADAFSQAAHTVKMDLINNRVVVNSMEPRAAVAEVDASTGKLTLHANTQGVWGLRDWIAEGILKTDAANVRVLTPDVGGGFGMKAMLYPEQAMVAFAASQLQRPVKWRGERSDAFLSDTMGRDHLSTAELALDADYRITGMRVHTVANLGAYLSLFSPFIPTGAALKVLPGVYDVKCLQYSVKGVLTNTTPVDAYRGAGRPESIYLMERLIETAARELGVDRLALRRKNFIPSSAMPFTTAAGEVYDTGEFETVMDRALQQVDWAGFADRKAESARKGKLRGIGMCYYIESTMGPTREDAGVEFLADGTVEVLVGTQSNGQGHETVYAQILHENLGVPFDKIRIVQGDSDRIKYGGGTGGSRSVTAEGWAINAASDKVVEKGKEFASRELEAAVADIEFGDGQFRIMGTDRAIGIMELAVKAREQGGKGLDSDASIEVGQWTFPNGCHIAEVEVEVDTGVTEVVRYSVVDDFGKIMNPMLVEGQVHGGVVQGIGQALMEEAIYDETGQLVTGSFVDYWMPRADNIPDMEFSTVEVLCKTNPIGMKGCGEAGTVGSAGAVMNALADALAERGVTRVDMPATPHRVWRLIHERQPASAA